MSKTFLDVKEKDVIEVMDEYSHDGDIHTLFVECIDFDEEYVTETNPEGKVCYCRDLDEEWWGDEYISVAHEGNFRCFSEQKIVLHWPYVISSGKASAEVFELYLDEDEAMARAKEMCLKSSTQSLQKEFRPGIEDLVLTIPTELQGLPKEEILENLVLVCTNESESYFFSQKEADEEIVCKILDYTSSGYTVEEESADTYRVFDDSTEFHMRKIKPEIIQHTKNQEDLERD